MVYPVVNITKDNLKIKKITKSDYGVRVEYTKKNSHLTRQKIIDVAYDVPSIARDLDWIAVMTYDYHGHWDKKTGHVAPFYAHPEDDFAYFNAVSEVY